MYNENYLIHHGVKGMKWGVRRYQNPDGSLTAKGKQKVKNKEQKIYSRTKKLEDSGHKYLGYKHEYRDRKKLYDKYGINKDFEKQHTRNLSYKNGKISVNAQMVVYKDVVVKDLGGTVTERHSKGSDTWKFSDGEYMANRIKDLYGKTEMNKFYDSYKHR